MGNAVFTERNRISDLIEYLIKQISSMYVASHQFITNATQSSCQEYNITSYGFSCDRSDSPNWLKLFCRTKRCKRWVHSDWPCHHLHKVLHKESLELWERRGKERIQREKKHEIIRAKAPPHPSTRSIQAAINHNREAINHPNYCLFLP